MVHPHYVEMMINGFSSLPRTPKKADTTVVGSFSVFGVQGFKYLYGQIY
jgi:hypothetical protein